MKKSKSLKGEGKAMKSVKTSNNNEERIKCVEITLILIVIGVIVGLIGSLSIPLAYSITFFWPAVTVQVIGGIWFGWWGIIAGTVFPLISNHILGVPNIVNITFIPANFIQGFIPAFLMKKFNANVRLTKLRDHIIFAAGVTISNLLSALWSVTALYVQGLLVASEIFKYYLAWSIGNIFPALILGEIHLRIFSDFVLESKWRCDGWFN